MKKLNAIHLFGTLAFLVFGVAACAADTQEQGDETSDEGEEVGSAESEINTVNSCKSDAYWRAHANRVCGGHANIDWRNANRRYRKGTGTRPCPSGAVSVPFTCN